MKKIDPSVIVTSLISGIFGLISTTLAVILPRLLDSPKPMSTIVQSPTVDMIPSTPRDIVSRPIPLRAPSSIEEVVEKIPLISFVDVLYIVAATAAIIFLAVMIMKKIKNRRKNED